MIITFLNAEAVRKRMREQAALPGRGLYNRGADAGYNDKNVPFIS
jgi:hypothetical protein